MAWIELSKDHMEAMLNLGPGERIDPATLARMVYDHRLVHGVLGRTLAELPAMSGPLRRVIARGDRPTAAQDARTDLVFRPDPQGLGRTRVKPGDVLARLLPAVQPRPGLTVLGHVVQPGFARETVLLPGPGAELSADGLTLRAVFAGRPYVDEERIGVRREHVVTGGLTRASEDVDFDGDVEITGDVLGPISVRAGGNVRVEGRVEAASIVAGGNVEIAGGARGKAAIEAGGNVFARGLHTAKVKCAGTLRVEQALVHSDVEVAGEVVAEVIFGGTLKAGWRGEAQILGSPTRQATNVVLAPPVPDQSAELQQLEQEQSKIRSTLAYISPRIRAAQLAIAEHGPRAANNEALVKLLDLASALHQKDAALADRKRGLAFYRQDRAPRLEVAGQLHPGVNIWMGSAFMRVLDVHTGVSLEPQGGSIRVLPREPKEQPGSA